MKKIITYCDDCLEEIEQKENEIFSFKIYGGNDEIYHLCKGCAFDRIIESVHLMPLGVHCKICKGKGTYRNYTGVEPCGKAEYETVKCRHGRK